MSEEEKKTAKKPAKKAAAKKDDAATKEVKADKKPAAKKADTKKAKKADTGVKKQGKLIENIDLYDVIERPVITEKSTMASEHGKVVFAISPTATKTQVKDAVESMFGVTVNKVNTINIKGKNKRFRGRPGKRSDVRKAVVTLAEGQSIDIASGLK
ncbi:MAG: 50S ribosomal protein L23 [Rickettsiales bacterium]|nr:50S ribosomal protein L23 [Rickettsiales bacterium]|tara:strand:+ start:494 stop:961 length:468 start_codon:yes stop_codon:yes gene_type:complete